MTGKFTVNSVEESCGERLAAVMEKLIKLLLFLTFSVLIDTPKT